MIVWLELLEDELVRLKEVSGGGVEALDGGHRLGACLFPSVSVGD